MSADDSPKAGSSDFGDALVAALGFEPPDGSSEVAGASTVVADYDTNGSASPLDDPAFDAGSVREGANGSSPSSAEVDESTMSPAKGRGHGPKTFESDPSTSAPDPREDVGSVLEEPLTPSSIDGVGANGDSVPASVAFGETGENPTVSLLDADSSGVKPLMPISDPQPPAPLVEPLEGSLFDEAAPVAVSPLGETHAAPVAPPLMDPGVLDPGVLDPGLPAAAAAGVAYRQAPQSERVVDRMGELASRVPQLLDGGLLHRTRRVRARKVRRVVRHVDPWSVLTFSVLFHLCVFASLLLASVLVWNAAVAAGTIENIESFIAELGDYTTYEINGDVVFRAATVIAGILTLASSVLMVLLTVVFNLISDLVGGIRVTVIEEETIRVRRKRIQ